MREFNSIKDLAISEDDASIKQGCSIDLPAHIYCKLIKSFVVPPNPEKTYVKSL